MESKEYFFSQIFMETNQTCSFKKACLLISGELEQNILSCGFLSPIQSDHSSIYLKIKPLNDIMRGPGYWTFNSSLTEDAIYVSKMKI